MKKNVTTASEPARRRGVEPPVSGLLVGVRRFSVADGPGVRSTVLLKGCPMSCVWCDKPNVRSPHAQVELGASRCSSCGRCQDLAGPSPWAGDDLPDACRDCESCSSADTHELVRTVGQTCSVLEVMAILQRDQRLYKHGGGVTVGGGEPLLQYQFTLSLLAECRRRGWHTALDTNGKAPTDVFEAGVASADLVLFDLKETDLRLHEQWTGAPLEPIVRNLVQAAVSAPELWVRLPVVPGANDRDDHWAQVGELLKDLPGPPLVELVPHRAIRRGATPGPEGLAVPAPQRLAQIAQELERHGLTVRRP